MKRIAYFGGTFDPVHNGHLSIARSLVPLFGLDRFFFLPAFHAPHKSDREPTSAFHRFAMLSLATRSDPAIAVSTLELEKGEKRYTIDTLSELRLLHPEAKVFFVMGGRFMGRYPNLAGLGGCPFVVKPHYCYPAGLRDRY